ncbi:MAG: hypothetical protein GX899_05455 [Rikenellaceae bacterium]|jgi:shikimate dehydrogenase|nr:hypothetical protein [Rikenellaceae bacterium]
MTQFALIGHPLAGSGSPALFYRAYNGKWPYELVDEPDFEVAWKRFLKDYKAINISAPFKEKAFKKVDFADDSARAVGAVNIAVKTAKGIKGYNSDYSGVRKVLENRGFGKNSTAVVAGYGGAGKAAYAAAKSLGMNTVVCNRTHKVLRNSVYSTLPLEDLPMLAAKVDVLIYTLPVGLKPTQEGQPESFGLHCPVILEANYKTPSMQSSATKEYISGREWLLEQAKAGYRLMTGETPNL